MRFRFAAPIYEALVGDFSLATPFTSFGHHLLIWSDGSFWDAAAQTRNDRQ